MAVRVKKVREVSLVPAGANQLADVLVTKEGGNSLAKTFMAALKDAFGAQADPAKVEKALGEAEAALTTKLAADPEADAAGDGDDASPMLQALGEIVDILKMCGDCKPGKPCKKHAKAYASAMKKADEARSTSEIYAAHRMYGLMSALQQSFYEIIDDESVADKAKALEESFKQFKKAALEIEGTPLTAENLTMAEKATGTTETDKSIPAHVQKQFDEMKAAQEKAEARATAAETTAKENSDRVAAIEKERARERATVVVKEARGKLAGKIEDSVDLYLKNDEAGQKALLADWQAANAQIATSQLFAEIGRRGDPAPDSAEGMIEAAIKEIRAAEPSLTRHQAYAKALQRTAVGNAVLKERAERAGVGVIST